MGWDVNYDGYGRRWSWSVWRYCPNIDSEVLRKTLETIRVAELRFKLYTSQIWAQNATSTQTCLVTVAGRLKEQCCVVQSTECVVIGKYSNSKLSIACMYIFFVTHFPAHFLLVIQVYFNVNSRILGNYNVSMKIR